MSAANGSAYKYPDGLGPNPFAVLGLEPRPGLTLALVRHHALRIVVPHVFERGGQGQTTGPTVPVLQQTNDALLTLGQGTF